MAWRTLARFAVQRGEPGRRQQLVAVAQRDLELIGEVQHHLPARLRAARLDEGQVAGRHAGHRGQVELAETAAGAPQLQQLADAGQRGRDDATMRPCRPRPPSKPPSGATSTPGPRPDDAVRAELSQAIWADDGRFVDPLVDATGPTAIAAAIGSLRDQMPGHTLARTTAVDVHHDCARFGWTVHAPDGRLRQVWGFFGDPAAV